jgi:hypothetical protein
VVTLERLSYGHRAHVPRRAGCFPDDVFGSDPGYRGTLEPAPACARGAVSTRVASSAGPRPEAMISLGFQDVSQRGQAPWLAKEKPQGPRP